jgi:hypothetical protein
MVLSEARVWRDLAEFFRHQQSLGSSVGDAFDPRWVRRRELPEYGLDSLPRAGVNREPKGTNGR